MPYGYLQGILSSLKFRFNDKPDGVALANQITI